MGEPSKRPRAKGGSAAEREIIRLSSGCLRCQEPSCTGGCPIGVGIPSILSLASSGRPKDATALMRLRSPLASITGRLCPSDRFCEHACILARKDAPVSVHALESFLGDISLDLPVKKGKTARGNVLVIGSGPAGLTAAHDLHAEGFTVTVYEKETLLGGWLRSLPLEIIPPGILDSEINRLARSGIVFETSRPFEAVEGFPPKNYYAMVLATGAPGSTGKPLPIKRDNEGFIVIDPQYRMSRPCVYAAGGAIARFNCITEAMASARDMVGHLLRSHLFPPSDCWRKGLICPQVIFSKPIVNAMHVLIADEVDKECPARLRAAGFQVTENFEISPEELKASIGSYEVLVVRSRTKVTKEVLDGATKLRLIGRVGVGLDTIDTAAAGAKGIKVINTPQMSTLAVAELVISMMLNLVRGTHLANESIKKGQWEKKRFHGGELNGKTLGVVGFGRIGRAVAERAKAFGMKILVYDVIADEETLKRLGAERLNTLEELLPPSDIVTLHVPLLPETRKMINSKSLSLCKTGSYLVNASRGEVVDSRDLLDALKSKKLAGAALDVYENEPPKEAWEKELVALPNVVATPHIGAQTREAQVAGAIMVAENIINLIKPL